MKSQLKFYKSNSDVLDDCGNVLDIVLSSHDLNWPGIILEKGYSPYFYPNEVSTPYFYFALGIDKDLSWKAKVSNEMVNLKTPPGMIWINPPHSPFSHEISEPCYFVILAIEEKTFFSEFKSRFDSKRLQFLNNYNVQDEALKGIIELFLMEVQTGGRNGPLYLKNLLSLVTTHYINNYSNFADLQKDRESVSKFGQREMILIQEHIENHLDQNITIEELSDQLNCSKFYFLREFKKLNGITPYQYILSKKLDEAKRLLQPPEATISSVAYDLGFNDQAHFTRAFKNHFDLTPGQFKKQIAS